MNRYLFCHLFLLIVFIQSLVVTNELAAESLPVMVGASLQPGYDMGIDDDCERRNWINSSSAAHKISYSGGCDWAALFVTVGQPGSGKHLDLSGYTTISVDFKGQAGKQFWIGMKEYSRSGAGPRQIVVLRDSLWRNYRINIASFPNLDPSKVHSVFELIFDSKAISLEFRNLTLIK